MKLHTVEADEIGTLLERPFSEETPFVITRHGKPVAVLIPVANSDIESISLSLDPEFNALIQDSLLSYARDGGISQEEMEAMFADDSARTKPARPAGRTRRGQAV